MLDGQQLTVQLSKDILANGNTSREVVKVADDLFDGRGAFVEF